MRRFWCQVAFMSLMVAETMTVICRTTTTTTPVPPFITNDSGERLVMPKMSPGGVMEAADNSYDGMRPLRLKDILPEDPSTYDKMRPPKKEGRPCTVYFHVTVMSLDSINENSMTYVADVFFAQSWEDHRLRFPENMTSEYRLLEVEWLNELWRPDSFFKNAKQVTFQTMTIPNHYVWLYQDRKILYMVKLTLMLSCPMNFVKYPHDTQECKLQMESLSHTVSDLLFEWDPSMPLDVSTSIELPQLELIRYSKADCTQVYSTGNFTCLEAVFTLKRRLGYYLFHTYIPTCLIVIMSWVSFWIKPEAAPARVTLGVTSLLTLSTQHAKSQASLPPVSYIKAIDVFMSSCTVFVFLALMEYALVNILLGDSAAEAAAAKEAAATKEKLKQERNKLSLAQKDENNIRHALTFSGGVCTNATGPIMLVSPNDPRTGSGDHGRLSREWPNKGVLNPMEDEQNAVAKEKMHKCNQNSVGSTVGIGGFGFGLGVSAPMVQHHAGHQHGHPSHLHHHHFHQQAHHHHHSQEILSPPEYEMSTVRITSGNPGKNSPHPANLLHHHQHHHHHQHLLPSNDNDVSNMSDDATPSNLEVLIGSNGEEDASVSITTDNPIMLISHDKHRCQRHQQDPAVEAKDEEDDSDEKQSLSPNPHRRSVLRHRHLQPVIDSEDGGSGRNNGAKVGCNNNGDGGHISKKASILAPLMANHQDGRLTAPLITPTPSFPRLGGHQGMGGKPHEGPDPTTPAQAAQQMKNAEMAAAMDRRRKALAVDRFSRYFFPFSFSMLNCIYWIVFADMGDGSR